MTEQKIELNEKEMLKLVSSHFNFKEEIVETEKLEDILMEFFDLAELPLYQQIHGELLAGQIKPIDYEIEDVLALDLISAVNHSVPLPEVNKFADVFLLRMEYDNNKQGTFFDYVKSKITSLIEKQVDEVKKEISEAEQKYKVERLTGVSQEIIGLIKYVSGNKRVLNNLKKRAKRVKTEKHFETFKKTVQEHFTSKFKSGYKSLLKEEEKLDGLVNKEAVKIPGFDYYAQIAKGVRAELVKRKAIPATIELDAVQNKEELDDYLHYLATVIPARQRIHAQLKANIELVYAPDKEVTVASARETVEKNIDERIKQHIENQKILARNEFKNKYFLQGQDLKVKLEEKDNLANKAVETIFLAAESNYDICEKLELANLTNKIKKLFETTPEGKTDKQRIELFVQTAAEHAWEETAPVIATALTNNYFVDELKRKNIIIEQNGSKYKINKKLIGELLNKAMLEREKEFFTKLKAAKVDTDQLLKAEYVYVPNPTGKARATILDPYKFCTEYLVDLVSKAGEHAKNDRQKEAVGLAKEIIIAKKMPAERELRKVLGKENKTYLENLILFLNTAKGFDLDQEGADTRLFNIFDSKDLRNKINNKEIIELPKKVSIYSAYRDVIVSELLGILQSMGKTHPNLYENFFTFWDRYDPTLYDLTLIKEKGDLKKEYHFQLTRDVDLLDQTRKISNACLTKEQLKGFAEDLGTLKMVISHDGVPSGYIRCFVMETKKGEPALALDTLEVGHPGMIGKDVLKPFPALIDSVRAMGLASIQLMMDANMKYLLGKDGRINHGLKQAFRDKQIKLKDMRKLGKPYPSTYGTYTMHYDLDTGIFNGEANVLFYNWRYSQNE
ncbi:hypothetical protein HY837_06215 [archaeon]|nr:hypothetical protein [archaeon]